MHISIKIVTNIYLVLKNARYCPKKFIYSSFNAHNNSLK